MSKFTDIKVICEDVNAALPALTLKLGAPLEIKRNFRRTDGRTFSLTKYLLGRTMSTAAELPAKVTQYYYKGYIVHVNDDTYSSVNTVTEEEFSGDVVPEDGVSGGDFDLTLVIYLLKSLMRIAMMLPLTETNRFGYFKQDKDYNFCTMTGESMYVETHPFMNFDKIYFGDLFIQGNDNEIFVYMPRGSIRFCEHYADISEFYCTVLRLDYAAGIDKKLAAKNFVALLNINIDMVVPSADMDFKCFALYVECNFDCTRVLM